MKAMAFPRWHRRAPISCGGSSGGGCGPPLVDVDDGGGPPRCQCLDGGVGRPRLRDGGGPPWWPGCGGVPPSPGRNGGGELTNCRGPNRGGGPGGRTIVNSVIGW